MHVDSRIVSALKFLDPGLGAWKRGFTLHGVQAQGGSALISIS
jgi:hypothetical protein